MNPQPDAYKAPALTILSYTPSYSRDYPDAPQPISPLRLLIQMRINLAINIVRSLRAYEHKKQNSQSFDHGLPPFVCRETYLTPDSLHVKRPSLIFCDYVSGGFLALRATITGHRNSKVTHGPLQRVENWSLRASRGPAATEHRRQDHHG